MKYTRRIKWDRYDSPDETTAINQVLPMDFMSKSFIDDRALQTFDVIDDHNREGFGICVVCR